MIARTQLGTYPVAVLLDEARLDYRSRNVLALLRTGADVDLVWVGLAELRPDAAPGSGPALLSRALQWAVDLDTRRRGDTGARVGGQGCLSEVFPELPVLTPAQWRAALAAAGLGAHTDAGRRGGIDAGDVAAPPALLVSLSAHVPAHELVMAFGLPVWWFETQGGHTATSLEGFHPVFRNDVQSRVLLRAAVPGDPRRHLLGVGETRTHPSSPGMNRAALLKVSVRVFADALLGLTQFGAVAGRAGAADAGDDRATDDDSFLDRHQPAQQDGDRPWEPDGPAAAAPVTVMQTATLTLRALTGALHSRLRRDTGLVQWSIGLGGGGGRWQQLRLDALQWLEPPPDGYYADPFPVDHRGRTLLFLEQLHYATGRGTLAVMDADDVGSGRAPEPVLSRPFHLSFPNVLAAGGEHFMLPEQVASGALVLYRSHGFPGDWRPEATLLQMPAADPMLLHHDGHWWLFFTRADHASQDNNLQLYVSAQIDGPYRRHPLSPIREGLRGSRMAGRIFTDDGGRLIRPGQDCVHSYGGALLFYEITHLDPEDYRERCIGQIRPDPMLAFGEGAHTYNVTGATVAVDGYRQLRRGPSARSAR